MDHDGYKLFSFPNPSGPWFTMIRQMMRTFPEVLDAMPISMDGVVEYPSIYYHPTIQLVVMQIVRAVRGCLEAVCGEGKMVTYVPGKFVYYTNPNPAFPEHYRRRYASYIRPPLVLPSPNTSAHCFIVYFNMDPFANLEINVCHGSHKNAGYLDGLPTSIVKTTSPMVDDKGDVYETVMIPPNGVMLLDGRALECFRWRVPSSSNGAWMSFVLVVSDPGPSLFDGKNVGCLKTQAQPIVLNATSFTVDRNRGAVCAWKWLDRVIAPEMKKATREKGDWANDRKLRLASLSEAGLRLWPISPRFAALVRGTPLGQFVPNHKRRRETSEDQ